jgi:hypothetical protein
MTIYKIEGFDAHIIVKYFERRRKLQKKKENLLEKIVKKDYDNELERVLETKRFDERAKNLLLEILYKLEISYKDYKKVKRDVESKEEYITKIIKSIERDCDDIQLVIPSTQNPKEAKKQIILIDKKSKKIICLPIERKLLYCIAKISKQSQIIKEDDQLINEIITNAINEGNNINMVEPLRDFNGWSWSTTKGEIENISYNLIYQNLRILVGNEFLIKWIYNKEYILNYYELLKTELEEKYSREIKDELINKFEELCIIVERESSPQMKQRITEKMKEIKINLEKTKDKRKYIDEIVEIRNKIQKKIKNLDMMMADKTKIKEEFRRRNKDLPIKEKIFSIKSLIKILNDERELLMEEYEGKTNLLNPSVFMNKKEKEQKKYKLLENRDIEETLIQFQQTFLHAFQKNIEKAEKKEEIINLIYEFRYYQMLPFDKNTNIYEKDQLKDEMREIEEKILKKAINNKVINENIEQTIFHYIFLTKIINLEEIYIQIKKEEDKILLELSENNNEQYDERFEIKKEEVDEDNIFRSYKDSNRFKLFS